MPYRQLEKAIAKSSVLVKTGTTCVKKQLPFTKLTLCPNADGSSFAVIFSMSHVVANGNGYYAVQNMLADNGEIFAIDPVRNEALVCVVEDIRDLLALESTGQYRGKYHVLGGVISPMDCFF